MLGQGSFAVVKLVVDKKSGEERALKIVAKKPMKGSPSNEKMLKEEIHILGSVRHPHILQMHDLYETKEGVFIVTDLCRGGELFDRLVEKVHYNELDARHLMRQILSGVAYLHDSGIIHRDLKPENILLRNADEPSEIVISDFGLSRFMPSDTLLMTACGSPQYVSPEVLLGKGYNAAVDVWSCGVIAYCLLAGYTPFYGEDQPSLFRQIVEMRLEFEPQYWSEISALAKDFIRRCLCRADRRMSAHQALDHPWLKDLPALHDQTADEERGACLKENAKRHAEGKRRRSEASSEGALHFSSSRTSAGDHNGEKAGGDAAAGGDVAARSTSSGKFARAVTAVEVVDYLTKLHTLRKDHTSREMIPDESLASLQQMVDHLQAHQDELDSGAFYSSQQQQQPQDVAGEDGAGPKESKHWYTAEEQEQRAEEEEQHRKLEKDDTHATLTPEDSLSAAADMDFDPKQVQQQQEPSSQLKKAGSDMSLFESKKEAQQPETNGDSKKRGPHDMTVMMSFMPDGWAEKLQAITATRGGGANGGSAADKSNGDARQAHPGAPGTPGQGGTAALAAATGAEDQQQQQQSTTGDETVSAAGSSPGRSSVTIRPGDAGSSSQQRKDMNLLSASATGKEPRAPSSSAAAGGARREGGVGRSASASTSASSASALPRRRSRARRRKRRSTRCSSRTRNRTCPPARGRTRRSRRGSRRSSPSPTRGATCRSWCTRACPLARRSPRTPSTARRRRAGASSSASSPRCCATARSTRSSRRSPACSNSSTSARSSPSPRTDSSRP